MKRASEKESDYLIRKRELSELFDSTFDLNVNLWRGQKTQDKGMPVLYPILKSFQLSNGRTRTPDIRTYIKNDEPWIDSKSGGISLFDVHGVPNKRWDYFLLPAGTKVPHGLAITKDAFNTVHQATHYSIKAMWDMPLKNFLMLLDQLSTHLIAGK